MGKKSKALDAIFNNKGEVKHKSKLSPFFLRPAYQYTPAECKDKTQQTLHDDSIDRNILL